MLFFGLRELGVRSNDPLLTMLLLPGETRLVFLPDSGL